jgi:hypothetical protein
MAMALNLLKALVLLLEAPAARQDALANCLKPTKHIRPNRRRRFYLVLAVLVDWPRDRWATPCRTARRPVKARAARAGRPAPEDPTTWTVTDDWPEDGDRRKIAMTTPVRAALYLRVSTGRQADNDLSIPDQRRQAKGYCASRGWEIVAHYVEPGVSAIDDRRLEFQRMIDAATTKPPAFEVILVHRPASVCAPSPAATAATISARSPSASKSTRKKFASWARKAHCFAHCRSLKRKNGGFWRAQFCTQVARQPGCRLDQSRHRAPRRNRGRPRVQPDVLATGARPAHRSTH